MHLSCKSSSSQLLQVCSTHPVRSAGFNIKCKNCTFEGSINLVAGSLTMGPFNSTSNQGILNQSEALEHYIQDGYVAFTSNSFSAHVELDSTIEASAELESYTIPLPTIPITPLLVSKGSQDKRHSRSLNRDCRYRGSLLSDLNLHPKSLQDSNLRPALNLHMASK